MESQRDHLNIQRKFIRPPMVFHEIREEGNILLKFEDSRVFLRNLGIDGEIISTIGGTVRIT